MEQLLAFESNVQKHFDGGNPEFTLPKKWHNIAEKFRNTLANSRPMLQQPRLSVRTRHNADKETPTPAAKTHRSSQDPIEIDSASDDEESREQLSVPDRVIKKRTNGDTPPDSMAKRVRMSDIPQYTGSAGLECEPLKTASNYWCWLTEIQLIRRNSLWTISAIHFRMLILDCLIRLTRRPRNR